MANERGSNKRKREQKKIERIKILIGTDLCACGGGNKLRCEGSCRKCHINSSTGQVECGAMYQIDSSVIKQSGSRRPKRDWKYGRQKEVNENKLGKEQRREKRERNLSK
jgi:hypothetical protein